MHSTRFADLAAASEQLAATRSRLEKARILRELLVGVGREEIAAAVGWLVEEPLCGPLGVGPAHLWALSKSPPAEAASLTLRDVEDALAEARGGSRDETLSRVEALFSRLTLSERHLFVGALTASLRQGSLGGVMLVVLAQVANRTEAEARHAVLVHGSITRAAPALLSGEATPSTVLELFRPLSPMLAAPAHSIEEALSGLGEAQIEWKIDGIRAQVHKKGGRVAVYSRQGNDITAGAAPVVGAIAALPADALVLDGEIVLVAPDGTARPFQDSFSAVAGVVPEGDHLRFYAFDCLHLDGRDLLDVPLAERAAVLRAVLPDDLRVPQRATASVDDAKAFYDEAIAAGHEGVMIKELASTYRFGARGRAWQKVKEVASVDLVILAAEWGSGRRKGYLSNLHLGARRDDGTFCMIGKTFKGLTDAMLRWQTAKLGEIAIDRTDHVVTVRPEVVVEVRFNDVQRSPRYPGGIALRFARVVRYREDKSASEIEPLEALVARVKGAPPKPKAATKPPKRQLSLFDE